MDPISVLIDYLKSQKEITDLEKDILDTWDELQKIPFDGLSARQRMGKNYTSYPDIFVSASLATGEIAKPDNALSDEQVKGNLHWQLTMMAEKELEALLHDQQT